MFQDYTICSTGKNVADAGPDAQREAFLTAANNARGSSDLIHHLKAALPCETINTEIDIMQVII